MAKAKLKQLNLFENEVASPMRDADPVERLSELLPVYIERKTEMDGLKKIVDTDNKEIKDLMREAELTEFEADGVKATYSVSERPEFIEEALIEKLKDMKVRGIIKKKEYVDMEALENAIYHGKIDAAALASCQNVKQVITLRVKKI